MRVAPERRGIELIGRFDDAVRLEQGFGEEIVRTLLYVALLLLLAGANFGEKVAL